MNDARRLVDAGVRLIDISADFRIQDVAEWEKWYKVKHACPELIRAGGLWPARGQPRGDPQGAHRRQSGLLSDRGAAGLLPLLEAGAVDAGHLIADAKSGVSGAGRKAETHILFSEASDNFKAYGVPGHRHGAGDRPGPCADHRQRDRPDVRAAPDADDTRHPCHAVRAHHARAGFPGAVRAALRRRALRRRAAARQSSRHPLGARRQHLPHRRAPARRVATPWWCSR